MRLLVVTPELANYSGSSTVAQTCWALPKALRGLGHEVTVVSPRYGFIDPSVRGLARRLRKLEVTLGEGHAYGFELYDARTAGGIDLLFLGQSALFSPCQSVPTEGGEDEDAIRFAAFSRAVLELVKSDHYDVVHCFGWPTGLLPLYVRESELRVPTVFTLQDASRHGCFDARLLAPLGVPDGYFGIDGIEFFGQLSFLKAGIMFADRVTTCSAAYARDIVQPGGAGGLEGALEKRGAHLVGVPPGVDSSVWNPATDPHLETRFDAMDRLGKRRCKAALQRELGLPVRDDVVLFGFTGAFADASGADRLARVMIRLLRNDVQIVLAGDSAGTEEALTTVLLEHQRRWPDRLQVRSSASVELVHRVLAGCDCLVVPRCDPGSPLPMRAQRYGALPLGPRKATFVDAVVDADAKLESGNGFTYLGDSDEEMLSAMQRATEAFSRRRAFERLRLAAMRADHSWDRSAYHYDRLVRALAAKPDA